MSFLLRGIAPGRPPVVVFEFRKSTCEASVEFERRDETLSGDIRSMSFDWKIATKYSLTPRLELRASSREI